MKIDVDGYTFEFPNAIDAFKFDEKDKESAHFHEVSAFKAVDMVVEFADEDLFVEIKSYDPSHELKGEPSDPKHKKSLEYLKDVLVRKYKDSYIYRDCEGKTTKPIFYICLLNLDAGMLGQLRKELKLKIPVKSDVSTWRHNFIKSVFVVDETHWNKNFLSRFGSCKKI